MQVNLFIPVPVHILNIRDEIIDEQISLISELAPDIAIIDLIYTRWNYNEQLSRQKAAEMGDEPDDALEDGGDEVDRGEDQDNDADDPDDCEQQEGESPRAESFMGNMGEEDEADQIEEDLPYPCLIQHQV